VSAKSNGISQHAIIQREQTRRLNGLSRIHTKYGVTLLPNVRKDLLSYKI